MRGNIPFIGEAQSKNFYLVRMCTQKAVNNYLTQQSEPFLKTCTNMTTYREKAVFFLINLKSSHVVHLRHYLNTPPLVANKYINTYQSITTLPI